MCNTFWSWHSIREILSWRCEKSHTACCSWLPQRWNTRCSISLCLGFHQHYPKLHIETKFAYIEWVSRIERMKEISNLWASQRCRSNETKSRQSYWGRSNATFCPGANMPVWYASHGFVTEEYSCKDHLICTGIPRWISIDKKRQQECFEYFNSSCFWCKKTRFLHCHALKPLSLYQQRDENTQTNPKETLHAYELMSSIGATCSTFPFQWTQKHISKNTQLQYRLRVDMTEHWIVLTLFIWISTWILKQQPKDGEPRGFSPGLHFPEQRNAEDPVLC